MGMYDGYFRNNYQHVYERPQQTNSILWVQGENGAKSWVVSPNTTVLLMDSESNRFYIKTADSVGMPTMKVYEYAEVTQQEHSEQEYCTKTELEALQAKYNEMIARLDKIECRKPRKQEETTNE